MNSPEQWLSSLGVPGPIPRLQDAFTHASFVNEHPNARDYQRLEFLGDAVIELCVSELLIARAPKAREGELTRMRASLVSTEALSGFARQHNLGRFVRMGKGARLDGGMHRPKVLADVVEAIVAAVYLAGGHDRAAILVGHLVGDLDQLLRHSDERDPKSALQELVQRDGRPAPVYELADSQTNNGATLFTVQVLVDGEIMAEASANSKKRAERKAASLALEKSKP